MARRIAQDAPRVKSNITFGYSALFRGGSDVVGDVVDGVDDLVVDGVGEGARGQAGEVTGSSGATLAHEWVSGERSEGVGHEHLGCH